MLSECANSSCRTPFRELGRGKLFVVETEAPGFRGVRQKKSAHRLQHYWLCDECSQLFTLVAEDRAGIVALPLVKKPGGVAKIEPVRSRTAGQVGIA